MAFLDIIVPQYKETDDIVRNLLKSVSRQKNVDFKEIGIIIVNDGTDVKLSDSLFQEFPELNITYLHNEVNVGQGQTEQNGVDHSKASYVTFVDSDDELYGDMSLCEILFGLHQHPEINILCTAMDQENKINGRLVHSKVTFNMLRTLHGVFIKRDYLLKYNVRFNKRLRYFEDTYFVTCLTSRNDMVVIGNVTYAWKWNEASKTLASSKYDVSVRHYLDMLNSYSDIYDYMESQNIPKCQFYIIQQLYELEAILESSFFSYLELKEKKEEYEKLVYALYLKHKEKFDKLLPNQRLAYQNYILRDCGSYYKGIKFGELFDSFIRRMESKEQSEN